MKILLIGEYSRLHNSLKEGLVSLGHDVLLVGDGDHFKNFPIDINIGPKIFDNRFLKPFVNALNRLTRINLIYLENAIRFNWLLKSFNDYDVIQLLNENSIRTYNFLIKKFVLRLIAQNKDVFILSCGIDYISVRYADEKKLKYSILTPFHENPKYRNEYRFILNKLNDSNRNLQSFLYQHVKGIISSDLDYHIPHMAVDNYLGMIPNPVNTDKLRYLEPLRTNKICIFHGVNSSSALRKGNVFFEKALKIIESKHADKVFIIKTKDLPYSDYINHYDECDIFLDQVYAYDQGYNALEAMAKGKVVFTGAEQDWLEYYNLEPNTVAINALPKVNYLVEKLEWLILNPDEILTISKNARQFIENEHQYIKIAQHYIDLWNKPKTDT